MTKINANGDRIRIHNTDYKIPVVGERLHSGQEAVLSFRIRIQLTKVSADGIRIHTLILNTQHVLQARDYTLGRKQFGRPLAANQLIQKEGGEKFRRFSELIESTVLIFRDIKCT
jgi:hypothetical protein